MKKSAIKPKKEEEQKMLEEKSVFEQKYKTECDIYRIQKITENSDFLIFINEANIKNLINNQNQKAEQIKTILFIKINESKLTRFFTEEQFNLISFICDSVLGFYFEQQIPVSEICFIINFYLNVFLIEKTAMFVSTLYNYETISIDTLFENQKEGNFLFIEEKINNNLFLKMLDYEINLMDSPFSQVLIFELPFLSQICRSNTHQLYKSLLIIWENKNSIKIETNFTNDFQIILFDFSEIFAFFVNEKREISVIQEIKSVERPKVFQSDNFQFEILKPLQSINAYQNQTKHPVRKINETKTRLSKDVTQEIKEEPLDEEAISFIEGTILKLREKLQMELDQKIAEANIPKKNKR